MIRQDFQQIALVRLDDAQALLEKNQYDGCCYLAGYCIELALKAVTCKVMERDDFFSLARPETARAFKIHNLKELIVLAGLWQKFEDLEASNPPIFNNWSVILNNIKWSEQLRYEIGLTEIQATNVVKAIAHPQNGILKWIKNYW
jgi:hypothetical protein